MASAEEDFIMLSTVETSFGEDLDLGLDSEFLKVVTKKEKRPIWSEKEVSTLLNIMIEKRILNLLDGKKYKRNDIFKLVQNNLQKKGFNRTTIQICNKWKQLKSVYAETKRANSKSGGSRTECPHFSSLEELLGTRPTQTLEGIDSGSAAAPSNLTTAGCSSAVDTVIEIAEHVSSDAELIDFTQNLPNIQKDNGSPSKKKLLNDKSPKVLAKRKLSEALANFSNDWEEKARRIAKEEREEMQKFEERMLEKQREMLEKQNKDFLNGLQDIFKMFNKQN